MSSRGQRMYEQIVRDSFVNRAGEILADWKRGLLGDSEAIQEFAYEYEDKVDDLPEADDEDELEDD